MTRKPKINRAAVDLDGKPTLVEGTTKNSTQSISIHKALPSSHNKNNLFLFLKPKTLSTLWKY